LRSQNIEDFWFEQRNLSRLIALFTPRLRLKRLPAKDKFAIIAGFPDSQGVRTCKRVNPAELVTLAVPCCHQAHKNHEGEDF
jgi:hypothetical protein